MSTNIVSHGFDIVAPDTAPTVFTISTGLVPPGVYRYKVSYVTHYGETLAGPASIPYTTTFPTRLNLINIPVRALGNVISRRLYRSNGGPYLLVGEVANNSATTYTDNNPTGTTPEPDAAYASSVARELGWVINSRPQIVPVANITAATPSARIDQYTECAFLDATASGHSVLMPPVLPFQTGMQVKLVNNSVWDILAVARPETLIESLPSMLIPADTAIGFTFANGIWNVTETTGGSGGGGGGIPSFSTGTTGLTPVGPTAAPVVLGGTLNAANGGTGRSTLTANALLAGNGTSPVQMLPITYNGATLTNVPNPVNLLDAVNKQYVDSVSAPAVLDPNATPTYPTNATNGVWYGLDTRANSFDTTSVTIGRSARTTGTNATALGTQTRAAASTTAVGYNVLPIATGGNNVAVGVSLAPLLTSGTNNVLVGLGIVATAASSNNVFFGHTLNTQSNNNVLIGHTLGASLTTGSGNIVVGRNCDVNSGARAGSVMLGNGLLAIADNATYIQRRQATNGTVTLAAWTGNEIVEVPGVIFGASVPVPGSSTTVGTYTAQTVSNLPLVDIFSLATVADTAYAIRANFVLGSNPHAGAYHINARAKNIAGTLTLSPLIVASDATDAALVPAVVALAQTGTTLHIRLTGVSGLTIKWTAYIEVITTLV